MYMRSMRSRPVGGKAAAIALRVIRQQRRYQLRPRRHRLDLGKKSVSASLLLLMDELGVGERGLLHGCLEGIEDVMVPVQDVQARRCRFKSMLPWILNYSGTFAPVLEDRP